MQKSFNINGLCYPDENYMVNLEERLKEIKTLVDGQKYFVINRARQYGKTTTLWALRQYLQQEYIVISMSFQRMSSSVFEDEFIFSRTFAESLLRIIRNKKQGICGLSDKEISNLDCMSKSGGMNMVDLFVCLSDLCETAERPVILMIDEVDSAANNQVFLDFLGLLRDYYLDRKQSAIFHSVILAGVYDIKNLKQKLRQEEEHRYNSPWNIAADFDIDMSFSVRDIAGMLEEYEKDHQTKMNLEEIAQMIFDYTSGYPYLVSKICKVIDEKLEGTQDYREKGSAWSKSGITEAVKRILTETNTLFDDMQKKMNDYPKLREMLYAMLFYGQSFPYNPNNHMISIGVMFGFLENQNGQAAVANRIFETWFYNLFMSEEMMNDKSYRAASDIKNQFIQKNVLNMDMVLIKFMEHFTEVYSGNEEHFIEENGRKLFLLYLKPIINGTGNYYVEARTRDQRRTDVIVDYLGKQYVIEMKIWHGDEYNRRGEEQILDYLDSYHLKKGYLLSFNFNKNKQPGAKEIRFGDKYLLEVVV